ncbi:MAG: hypothetical protein KBC22_01050 [Candidatus Pacebacteria bacterium]|nr:hypothetical protein [Candidatus Paceibacterota bacterium]
MEKIFVSEHNIKDSIHKLDNFFNLDKDQSMCFKRFYDNETSAKGIQEIELWVTTEDAWLIDDFVSDSFTVKYNENHPDICDLVAITFNQPDHIAVFAHWGDVIFFDDTKMVIRGQVENEGLRQIVWIEKVTKLELAAR